MLGDLVGLAPPLLTEEKVKNMRIGIDGKLDATVSAHSVDFYYENMEDLAYKAIGM